nr:CaiB/BaiF CoA-transferase family protein [Burkholderia territorii]
MMKQGPLTGLKVVEFGAIGPVPFCAMMLADMGADVVHLARPRAPLDPHDVMLRGRRIVALDMKKPAERDAALDLVERADILLEGNRPGVMEQLGLGPDVCLARNPRLVYGRMTGWGQAGPLAARAGHDINYISLTGALDGIGAAGGAPVPPLNLVGDYGGGAMFLAFGVLCAHLESRTSGRGQIVDAAMIDGSAMLMALFCRMTAQGKWTPQRGANVLDGGAPWYTTYEAADGRYVAVGAIEEPFWQALLEGLGIAPDSLPPRSAREDWHAIHAALAARFAQKTRDEWAIMFADSDACVSPVLGLGEAPANAHVASRGSFIQLGGVTQPAPAPRFGRTPGEARPAQYGPEVAAAVFSSWGVEARTAERNDG